MTQKPVEVILMRQLASTLAMPIFLVDADGTLVYYNELAERVLGMRFEETGEMPASEWATLWSPTDGDGRALAPQELPLTVAATEGRPSHGEFWIKSLDGHRRHVQTTAFPLLRAPCDVVGAVAIFWEIP
jgi:PAS domain S-box-containing protein